MKNSSPLVTVIVPSYNHEKYIVHCIESIIKQTFKDFELIVIDDGSSDSSRDILSTLKNQYGFTLVLQKNMGLTRTFNKGIQQYARGKYVTFCASDDYWMPDKLEKQVMFMEQNPYIPMCYGKAYLVDEEDNVIQNLTMENNANLKGGYIFKDILSINFHPPVNYLFEKRIFEDVGYYKENIFTEDFYMNLRISNRYPIGYIDEYLSFYRTIRNYRIKPFIKKTAISHLECINEYKDSEYYPEAIRKWHFRNFIQYSSYRQHKYYAFKGMLHSARYFFDLAYTKAIIKLIIRWR